MDFFNFSNLALDGLAVAAVAALLIMLAALTMRSIAMRDRAMNLRRGLEDEASRVSYEKRWRTNAMRGA